MNKKNAFFLLIPLASASALVLALVAQYAFGLHPCELCQWQRVPYGLAVLAGIAYVLMHKMKATPTLPSHSRGGGLKDIHSPAGGGRLGGGCGKIFLLYFLLMAAETALAFYHFAVEKGYVSSGCSTKIGGAANAQEMLDKIMAAPVVSCNQPQFEFLHLSMAGWNGIYALFLTIVAITLYASRRFD